MQRQNDKRWHIPAPLPPEVDAELHDFQPYLRQILFNRNVRTAAEAVEYLNCSAPLGDPFLLMDMDRTVERLWRAIDSGEIDRYGALLPSDGGHTHRHSLSGEWAQTGASGASRANVYVVDYGLNLFSSPSGFITGLGQRLLDIGR